MPSPFKRRSTPFGNRARPARRSGSIARRPARPSGTVARDDPAAPRGSIARRGRDPAPRGPLYCEPSARRAARIRGRGGPAMPDWDVIAKQRLTEDWGTLRAAYLPLNQAMRRTVDFLEKGQGTFDEVLAVARERLEGRDRKSVV